MSAAVVPGAGVSQVARAVWRRMRRMTPQELASTLRAATVLAAVELAIRWVSLPRLSRVLGVRLNLEAGRGTESWLPVEDLPERARLNIYATRRVTRVWPFCNGPCLRQALVGSFLIRGLDPSVRIGVGGGADSLRAHAWIEIGNRPLEELGDLRAFERAPAVAGQASP